MGLRFRLYRLMIVSLLVFTFIWLFQLKTIYDESPEKPVHILILSSWRSGSSFVGQIFNHHPDVFYLYEPGRVVWVKFPHEKASLLHYPVRDLLHSLFNCDMSPLHDYLSRNGRYISDLPFWSESRALCFPPACRAFTMNEPYDRPSCFQRCGYVPLEKMTEACSLHRHVVLKTVRVLDLGVLLPLLQDPRIDLRIVHLVRDPRAVAFSRLNFGYLKVEDLIVTRQTKDLGEKRTKVNVTDVMANICRAQTEIYTFSQKNKKSMQGRYLMVRYEDLAREPLSVVDQIFNFAALSFTEDFREWLQNVTNHRRPKQYGFMNFAEDSRKVIVRWRGGLKHSISLEIQEQCREAMKIFGYTPVRSTKEQNDLSFSVMTNFESNDKH